LSAVTACLLLGDLVNISSEKYHLFAPAPAIALDCPKLLMLASSTHVLEGAKGKKGLAKSSTFDSLPVIPSSKGGRRDHDPWTKTCISLKKCYQAV